MKKPAIWMHVIIFILLLLALILLLTGCNAIKKEQQRDRGRVLAHQEEPEK